MTGWRGQVRGTRHDEDVLKNVWRERVEGRTMESGDPGLIGPAELHYSESKQQNGLK